MGRYLRSVLVLALVASLALPQAISGVGDDAGTGVDAPDKRSQALALAYGSYSALTPAHDTDWYRVDDLQSSVRCVSANVAPAAASVATLRVNNGVATRTTSVVVAGGNATARLGIAGPSLFRSHFGISSATDSAYVFELSGVGPDSGLAGEGVDDAGGTLASALPTDTGCFGGSLGRVAGLVDMVDLYSFHAQVGDTIYYSLGASADGVQAMLLSADNAIVGMPIVSGDMAGYYVDTGGTYYLSAQRTSTATPDSAYALGLLLGPDPGAGCRPGCYVTE